jgi:O-antigen/teichoic acid export membrane protein
MIMLAAMPVLTRLYEPAAFGLHAMVMAFVGIASVGSCLCIELAIVASASDKQADEFFAAALMSLPLTSLASGLVLTGFIYFDLLGYGALPIWTAAVATLVLVLNGIYVAARHRRLRNRDYPIIARANLIQNVGRALVPFALFPLVPTWLGLTSAEVIGRALSVRGLLTSIWPGALHALVWGDLRQWIAIVRREYRYTCVLLGSVFIDASASLLIAPLLAATYGAVPAGQYFLISMLLTAPFLLVASPIGDVLHVRGANLYRETPARLPAFTRKLAFGLLAIALAIYFPIYLLAPFVFPSLLGAKWPYGAEIAMALTPFSIISFVASPCSRLLMVVNRPGLKVCSDAFRLAGVPITIYVCHSSGASFVTAVWALSWFLAVAYFVYFLVTYEAVTLRRADSIATTAPQNR